MDACDETFATAWRFSRRRTAPVPGMLVLVVVEVLVVVVDETHDSAARAPAAGSAITTVAVPVAIGSATLVACTWKIPGEPPATYDPVPSMLPPDAVHVTV
jgi:hypothetical protein